MKIAVVGCGALGSYYGARLCQAGHQVHFLLRSDFEAVRRDGVCIESAEGTFHVRPVCARQPTDIGTSNLVLICLKTTANHALPQLLPPWPGRTRLSSPCKTVWATKPPPPPLSAPAHPGWTLLRLSEPRRSGPNPAHGPRGRRHGRIWTPPASAHGKDRRHPRRRGRPLHRGGQPRTSPLGKIGLEYPLQRLGRHRAAGFRPSSKGAWWRERPCRSA